MLDAYQSLTDPIGEARIRYGIGDVHRRTGRYTEAATHCRYALGAFRELGDRLGEADTLLCLGGIHFGNGEYGDAERCYEDGCAMYRKLDDGHGEAGALRGLAELSLAGDNRAQAVDLLERAHALLDALGSPEAADVRSQIAEAGGTL